MSCCECGMWAENKVLFDLQNIQYRQWPVANAVHQNWTTIPVALAEYKVRTMSCCHWNIHILSEDTVLLQLQYIE